VYGHPERDALGLGQAQRQVGAEIRLVQDDDGLGAALPRGRQVALEAARLEVAFRQRHDEKHHVDVRGEHLLLALQPRHLAREPRASREHGVDPLRERDPVADGREVGRGGYIVAQAAGHLRPALALLGVDEIGAALLDRDAARHEAIRFVLLEGLGEERAPAEPSKVEQREHLLGGSEVAERCDGRRRGATQVRTR
jgi:hypothetical protein